MKKLWLAVIFCAMAASIHPAAALSTSDDSTSESMRQGGDSGEPLSDPDDQTPNFAANPDNGGTRNGELSINAPDATMPTGVNMPVAGDHDSGERAFDHALEHQQDNQ